MISSEHLNYSEQDPPRNEAAESLAVTATFVALASIGASFVFPIIIPFILAPVAIILAILSKGRAGKLSQTGKRAVMFAVIGIGVNIMIIGVTFRSTLTLMKDPLYHARLNEMTTNMYGYSFDSMLQTIDDAYGTNLTELFGITGEGSL